MLSITLEELLRKKHEAECKSSENEIDWEGRKDAWLRRINELFVDIEKWLKPHLDNRLLEIERTQSVLNEQHIGSYSVPKIEMLAGTDRVSLSPVATLIVGSYGRIDMSGPKGRKLMLVLSDTDQPASIRIRVSVWDEFVEDSHPGKENDDNVQLSSAEIIRDKCKWYFVDLSERTRKTLVTNESFERILVGMLQS